MVLVQKSLWDLKFRPNDGCEPKFIHFTFSPNQISNILHSVKQRLGSAYSITQLGHAAMIMAVLKLKPNQDQPSEQKDLVSPLFIKRR